MDNETITSQGSGNLPSGSILLWSGLISTIPVGFQLCDGTNGSPDLRNRFIVGSGSDSGNYTADLTEFGSGYFHPSEHGGAGMHKLTISEMPKHNHQITNFLDTWGSITIIGPGSGGWLLTVPSTNLPTTLDSGGDQPHSIMPPYYSLAYIMKL